MPPALQADSLPAEPHGKLKNTGVGAIPSPEDLPDPRTEPGSPALQADSLPTELSGYGVSTVRNTHIFNCEEGSASPTPILFKGQLYFHLMVYQNFLTPACTSSQEAIVKF